MRSLNQSIRVELELGMMFVRLSRTRRAFGALARAEKAMADARQTYQIILKHFHSAALSDEERCRLKARVRELEQAIERLPV